ncbi:DUF4360 domain-containing protein [Plectonema cf. radiosum LEGE 06105]|uniref:DUF4360 domain-containing protein n=1 Tax=Plectonema cf. radiosum LEGE 06105 TaxID=945769 RepID=A0A8J7JWW1_9CYAN|nr:DUF4360 domain-containing protein [Plectonema radiosum]MBE9216055.1 DUF4360 domain-containing protein [Plectonema cf. radiosum LEGE 06105]
MNSKNIHRQSISFVKTLLATATVMAASVAPAFAQPKVQIVGANYGGSGCPAGSASVTVSPDGQELSILFDGYVADASAKPAERRKNCNLTIPVKVPAGFQVSVYKFDYRGYVAPATTGRLTAEYFFAGQRGPKIVRNIRGEKDYLASDNIQTLVWSRCGDSVNMRVNSGLSATGRGIASLDSVDVSHGLKYLLKYRACS